MTDSQFPPQPGAQYEQDRETLERIAMRLQRRIENASLTPNNLAESMLLLVRVLLSLFSDGDRTAGGGIGAETADEQSSCAVINNSEPVPGSMFLRRPKTAGSGEESDSYQLWGAATPIGNDGQVTAGSTATVPPTAPAAPNGVGETATAPNADALPARVERWAIVDRDGKPANGHIWNTEADANRWRVVLDGDAWAFAPFAVRRLVELREGERIVNDNLDVDWSSPLGAAALDLSREHDAAESELSQLRQQLTESEAINTKQERLLDQLRTGWVEGVVREGIVRGSIFVMEPAVSVQKTDWPIGTLVQIRRQDTAP